MNYYKKFTIDRKLLDITSEATEKFATKTELFSTDEDIQKKFKDLEERLAIERAQSRKQNSDIEKIRKDIMDVHSKPNLTETFLQSLHPIGILKTKTGATETELIKKQLKDFAFKQDLKELETRIVPTVDKARLQIIDFKDTLYKQSQMIRRFDEVICDKASKTSIQEVCLQRIVSLHHSIIWLLSFV